MNKKVRNELTVLAETLRSQLGLGALEQIPFSLYCCGCFGCCNNQ